MAAVLVIVPYAVSRSPREFHDLVLREQVSVLNQIPSAFMQLMQVQSVTLRRGCYPCATSFSEGRRLLSPG